MPLSEVGVHPPKWAIFAVAWSCLRVANFLELRKGEVRILGILGSLDSGFWISLRVRPWRCSWWDVYPVWLGGSLMLVHDYIHPTPHGGHCRVRIYDATTVVPVIVCTELTYNPGQSITNAAKQIAAEVLENHPHVFDPFALASIAGLCYDKPFVWVEHYYED